MTLTEENITQLLNSTDARVWAAEFCELFGLEGSVHRTPIDDGLMIGWFANAMMTMYDDRTRHLEEKHKQEMFDFTAFMSTRPFCGHLETPKFLQVLEEWEVEKQRRYDLEYNREAEKEHDRYMSQGASSDTSCVQPNENQEWNGGMIVDKRSRANDIEVNPT